MKLLLSLTLIVSLFFNSFGIDINNKNENTGFNYQAVVRKMDGSIKSNEEVFVQFEILDPDNNVVYSESHFSNTNEFGILNLVIGEGSTGDDFSGIDWSKKDLYVKVIIDGESVGTSKIRGVPYASFASNGVTPEQAAAIEANSGKEGISVAQANAINSNSDKLSGISAGEIGQLSGVTGNIQEQLNSVKPVLEGVGVTVTENNEVSIGQDVSENASVKFDQVILGEASEEDLKFVDPVTGHEMFYDLWVERLRVNVSADFSGAGIRFSDGTVLNSLQTEEGQNLFLGSGGINNVGPMTGYNISIGQNSMRNAVTARQNTVIGIGALDRPTETFDNVVIGNYAMGNSERGNHNVVIGLSAGNNISADQNTVVGYSALNRNVYGGENTAIGQSALYQTQNGEKNTAVGSLSFFDLITGQSNVAVGNRSGQGLIEGSNNIYIGDNAVPKYSEVWNETVIGANATGNGSSTVTLGDSEIESVYAGQDGQATVFAGDVKLGAQNESLNESLDALQNKQDKLTAGDNIQINDGVISASAGMDLESGENIDINDGIISTSNTVSFSGLEVNGNSNFNGNTNVSGSIETNSINANVIDLNGIDLSQTLTDAQATADEALETANEANNTADKANKTARQANNYADAAANAANVAVNTADAATITANEATATANEATATANEATATAIAASQAAENAEATSIKARIDAVSAMETAYEASEIAERASLTAGNALQVAQSKQDVLSSGNNISIDNNTVSLTDNVSIDGVLKVEGQSEFNRNVNFNSDANFSNTVTFYRDLEAKSTIYANDIVLGQEIGSLTELYYRTYAQVEEAIVRLEDAENILFETAEAVSSNADAIGSNADDIGINADAIGSNADDIGTNADKITGNSEAITSNTDAIGTNADDIGTNADDIGTNADAIGSNADGISGNKDAIKSLEENKQDPINAQFNLNFDEQTNTVSMNADVLDLNTFSAREVQTGGLNVNGVTGLNGNVDIRADVLVTGNSLVNGNSNVRGDAYVDKNSFVNGNSTVRADFNVDGRSTLRGEVKLGSTYIEWGGLEVENHSTLKGGSTVNGQLSVDGIADVTGDINVQGNANLKSITLDGSPISVTANDINSLDGIEGNVQEQLNGFNDDLNNLEINSLKDATTSFERGNLFLGTNAPEMSETSYGNTAIGIEALSKNINGNNNTAVGDLALSNNTDGFSNTAIGSVALRNNTTGTRNTAVGLAALVNNTTGSMNTAVGSGALAENTEGSYNTAVGRTALVNNTTGSENVAIGENALNSNTEGRANTAVGQQAMRSLTTGQQNTAYGYGTLSNNETGDQNTAIGRGALQENVEGNSNTAIGTYPLLRLQKGNRNIAIGEATLWNITEGDNNVAVGSGIFEESSSTSFNNVMIGNYIGADNNGDPGESNVALGNEISLNDNFNQIVIGTGANSAGDNTVVLGNREIGSVYAGQNGQAVVYAKDLIIDENSVIDAIDDIYDNKQDKIDSDTDLNLNNLTADIVVAKILNTDIISAGAFDGNVLGNLTGNVVGNVAGNVNGERVDSDLVEANKLVLTGEGELFFGEDKINASATEINTLSGVSENLQDQLDSKQSNLEVGTGVSIENDIVSIGQSVGENDDVKFNSVTGNLSGNLTGNVTGEVNATSLKLNDQLVELSADQLNFLNNVTSDIQAQIDAKGVFSTAGEGIKINDGVISIGQSVGEEDDVKFNSLEGNRVLVSELTANSIKLTNEESYINGNVNGNLVGNVKGNLKGNVDADEISANNLDVMSADVLDLSAEVIISQNLSSDVITDGNATLTNGKLIGLRKAEVDGTVQASKVKTNILTLGNDDVIANADEINALSGIVVDYRELNKLSGIEGNIQEQLNSKQSNISVGTGVNYENDILSIGQEVDQNANVTFNSANFSGDVSSSTVSTSELTVDGIKSENISTGFIYSDNIDSDNLNANLRISSSTLDVRESAKINELLEVTGTVNTYRLAAGNVDVGYLNAQSGFKLKDEDVNSTASELNQLSGIDGNVQKQLDSKASNISGAASSIAYDDLSSGRAVVSDASGKVATSEVTSNELNFLSGVTSNIQDQLDAKAVTFDAGTGVTLNENLISIGQSVGVEDDVQFRKVSASRIEDNYYLNSRVIETQDVTVRVELTTPQLYTDNTTVWEDLDVGGSTTTKNLFTDGLILNNTEIKTTADEINRISGLEVNSSELNALSNARSNIQEQIDAKGNSNVSEISDLGDGSVNSENSTVYIGSKPVEDNSGSFNTVISTNGLSANTTGSYNQVFGYKALNSNTTGNRNIAVGAESLSNSSEANDNVAIGTNSLTSNLSGSRNIGIGSEALVANTEGEDNTATGYQSFRNLSSGKQNTALGSNSGENLMNGSKNTVIGAEANVKNLQGNDATNQTVIGFGAVSRGNNSVVLGNRQVDDIYANTDGSANVHAGGLYLNGTEVEATAEELNKLSGVTSLLTAYGNSNESNYSLGFGINSNAEGKSSIALGPNTISSDYGQVVIGQYNKSGSTATSAFAYNQDVPAFVIGNGKSSSNRSDALVVGYDGNANLSGTLNVGSKIYTGSDITSDAGVTAQSVYTKNLFIHGEQANASASEINNLVGVEGNIQSQLNSKQNTLSGAVTSITDENLSAGLAVVSDESGKVSTTNISTTELNQLSGVATNIQDQLDSKQSNLSEGVGVKIDNNVVSIAQSVGTDDDVTFGSVETDRIYSGDLTANNIQSNNIDAVGNVYASRLVSENANISELEVYDIKTQNIDIDNTISISSQGLSLNTNLVLNGQAVEVSSEQLNQLNNIQGNVQDQLDGKQEKLTAGTNISIQDGVISALTDLEGNLTGNVEGDVEGNLTGNVFGTVSGNLIGDVEGTLTGHVDGSLSGDVVGDVVGDLQGNVEGDVFGNVEGNLTGDVEGNVSALTLSLNGESIDVSSSDINSLSNISGNVQDQLNNKQGTLKAGPGIRLDEYGFISTLSAGISELNDLGDVVSNSSSLFLGEYGDNTRSGDYNVVVGNNSLSKNTDGSSLIAVGYNVLNSNTVGSDNIGIGTNALSSNTSGRNNISLGSNSLTTNATGSSNIAVGNNSLISNTSGSFNTLIGHEAMNNNTSGKYNTAIGFRTLLGNGTGDQNTAVGYFALGNNMSGKHNVSVGNESSKNNEYGSYNVAFGSGALYGNTDGNYNVALGPNAMRNSRTGGGNIAIGSGSLFNNTGGSANSSIGQNSLRNLADGSYNVAIGRNSAMTLEGGNNNVVIGYGANVSGKNVNNEIVIGYNAKGKGKNTASIGTGGISKVYFGNGNATLYADNLNTSSDFRLKRNIKNLSHGLNFILNLNPVSYLKMKMSDYLLGSDVKDEDMKYEIGLLAQDVKNASEEMGFENEIVDVNEDGLHMMDYTKIIMPLVKGMQEQQEIINSLKKEIEDLKKMIKD